MAANTKKAQLDLQTRLMETLRELGGQTHGDDMIVYHPGRQILVPEGMELLTLHKVVQKKIQDEEQDYAIGREFHYRPHDGFRAVRNVLRDHFGWATGMAVKSFFGTKPPELITIDVGVGETEQVPSGWIELPMFEGGKIHLGASSHAEYGIVFSVHAQCKKKFEGAVAGLFKLIQRYLETDSIYRGKAITASENPEFIDVTGIDPEDVIYTHEVMRKLKTYVWANIWYPQQLRDIGELGKRLTILFGDYGVGKTLAAYLTAWYCLQAYDNDPIGFIIVRPGQDDWVYAMQMAKLYGRCIIFIEDIDTIIDTTDQRQISMVLDQLDGLRAKGSDVSMIFTTNHIDKIHKGVLRPGRTDGVIEVGSMDEDGVARYARRVIGDNLSADYDSKAVFHAVREYTPAYVREVFSRAKRTSMVNHDGVMGEITTQDLVDAADDLRPQLALMQAAPELQERSGIDGALNGLISAVVNRKLETSYLVNEDGDWMYAIRTDG